MGMVIRHNLPVVVGSGGERRTEFVQVEVDFEALAYNLGPRAITSKGGKAVEANGNVVVRRLKKGA